MTSNSEAETVVMSLYDAQQLASRFLKRAPEQLRVSVLSGGITNKLFMAEGEFQQRILIRQFGIGTDLIIDRDREAKVLDSLSPLGFAPRVYLRFANGFIYEYLEGKALEPEEMQEPSLQKLIAPKVARWHKLKPQGVPTDAVLFPTLRNWLEMARGIESLPTEIKTARLKELDFDRLAAAIDRLERELAPLESPLVFCHNDLLSGNVLVRRDGKDIHLIDFEYAAYNPRGFDLGNHFCEYAGFECAWERYPDEATAGNFAQLYLGEWLGRAPTPLENERLRIECNAYGLCAHLWWGIWAVLQASMSTIDEIDYIEYAHMRLNRYYETENKYLALVPRAAELIAQGCK